MHSGNCVIAIVIIFTPEIQNDFPTLALAFSNLPNSVYAPPRRAPLAPTRLPAKLCTAPAVENARRCRLDASENPCRTGRAGSLPRARCVHTPLDKGGLPDI